MSNCPHVGITGAPSLSLVLAPAPTVAKECVLSLRPLVLKIYLSACVRVCGWVWVCVGVSVGVCRCVGVRGCWCE